MSSSPPVRRLTDSISIGLLTRVFRRDLIDDALMETRRVEQRTRLLPARVVVYYVLAMCLFCGDSYGEVMRKLVNGLRGLGAWRDGWTVPTASAICKARQRLGEEPLKVLFDRLAQPIAVRGQRGSWFHHWRVMAVDGVVLTVPDSEENAEEFGKGGNKEGDNAFPQVRLVAVAECGTHAVVGAEFDSQSVHERELLRDILPFIEPGMLVLADRGFYSYDMWKQTLETGADLLWRVKDVVDLPVLEVLPDGSYRSELLPAGIKKDLKRGKRRSAPAGTRIPVRVAEYTVPNRVGSGETFRLITTIMDHVIAPAMDLAKLYRQRWEIELVFAELEVHQMNPSGLLRSRTPEMVRQEIWALLLAHYAIRDFMNDAADSVDIDPDLLSFTESLNIVRRQVVNQAGFSP